MDLLDTAWCPVCDRQIPPEILTVPPSAPAPTAIPSKTRTGTIKAHPAAGARRAAHARPKASSSSSPPKPPTPPAASTTKSGKPKTYISQAPTPLYCSPECELADALPSRLSLAIPSPSNPAYARHPASPVLISGSSGSSDGGAGSFGSSPFSGNSDYFAYLEGRPRRRDSNTTSATNTTGSSSESLSSLTQHQQLHHHIVPSRPCPSRTSTGNTMGGSRSRRPSSGSLAPRAPHTVGYAASPPTTAPAQSYTLSFTRAPSGTASPSSSPPVVSRLSNPLAGARPRSSSRASSALRVPLATSPPARSPSDASTPTPRAYNRLSSPAPSRRSSAQGREDLLLEEEQERERQEGAAAEKDKWWSWERLPHYVPTYEAMRLPPPPPDNTPAQGHGHSRESSEEQRKRLFYFHR